MDWLFSIIVALFPPLADAQSLGMRVLDHRDGRPISMVVYVWWFGDYDGNGRVDLRDVAQFQRRFARWNYGPSDWAMMEQQLLGPGMRLGSPMVEAWLVRK